MNSVLIAGEMELEKHEGCMNSVLIIWRKGS